MIREVNPVEHLDAITALLAAHWQETGFDFPLDPDRDAYAKLHDAGVLVTLAAFAAEQVVGYATAVVSPHLFNRNVTMCAADALFVRKDFRNTLLPGRLILAMEDAARQRGATHMYWQTRAGTYLAGMMVKHGYTPADVCVIKEL